MVNEVNCLPAPNNTLLVRLYWPKDTLKSILDKQSPRRDADYKAAYRFEIMNDETAAIIRCGSRTTDKFERL